jgi:hypothetical protein
MPVIFYGLREASSNPIQTGRDKRNRTSPIGEIRKSWTNEWTSGASVEDRVEAVTVGCAGDVVAFSTETRSPERPAWDCTFQASVGSEVVRDVGDWQRSFVSVGIKL